MTCQCEESRRPVKERAWVVEQRNCSHSAFNGWRWAPSSYSQVRCLTCRATWRTNAKYVNRLQDKE